MKYEHFVRSIEEALKVKRLIAKSIRTAQKELYACEVDGELEEWGTQPTNELEELRQQVAHLHAQVRTARSLVRGYKEQTMQLRADINMLLNKQVLE